MNKQVVQNSDPPLEIEAKFLADEEAAAGVAATREVGDFRLEPQGKDTLRSVYYDTADGALRRARIALRIRQHEEGLEATAKWVGHVRNGMHSRPELTVPLSRHPRGEFRLPAGPLFDRLAAVVAARPLQPLLTTEIVRETFLVRRRSAKRTNPALAELAIDETRLSLPTADEKQLRYVEIEVELRQGPERELRQFCSALQSKFALETTRRSKFERALELVETPPAVKPIEGPLRRGESLRAAASFWLGEQLGRMRASDPQVRIGDTPESLHQFRVATRRLRSGLRVFRKAIPQGEIEILAREVRWLARQLGLVRDIDVQQIALASLLSAGDVPARGVRRFILFLSGERNDRREKLHKALRSRRYFSLLVRLERTVDELARPDPSDASVSLGKVARRAIKRSRKTLENAAEAARSERTEALLHELRIRVKRFRYTLETFQDLTGKAGKRTVARLVALQDTLGNYHDAEGALGRLRPFLARAQPADRSALRRYEGALHTRMEDSLRRFDAAWKKFQNDKSLDDVRQARRSLIR